MGDGGQVNKDAGEMHFSSKDMVFMIYCKLCNWYYYTLIARVINNYINT